MREHRPPPLFGRTEYESLLCLEHGERTLEEQTPVEGQCRVVPDELPLRLHRGEQFQPQGVVQADARAPEVRYAAAHRHARANQDHYGLSHVRAEVVGHPVGKGGGIACRQRPCGRTRQRAARGAPAWCRRSHSQQGCTQRGMSTGGCAPPAGGRQSCIPRGCRHCHRPPLRTRTTMSHRRRLRRPISRPCCHCLRRCCPCRNIPHHSRRHWNIPCHRHHCLYRRPPPHLSSVLLGKDCVLNVVVVGAVIRVVLEVAMPAPVSPAAATVFVGPATIVSVVARRGLAAASEAAVLALRPSRRPRHPRLLNLRISIVFDVKVVYHL